MNYRIHLEPIDIEADNIDDTKKLLMLALLENKICVSKIIPIDKDGFPLVTYK